MPWNFSGNEENGKDKRRRLPFLQERVSAPNGIITMVGNIKEGVGPGDSSMNTTRSGDSVRIR